jgi:hypothetical protein
MSVIRNSTVFAFFVLSCAALSSAGCGKTNGLMGDETHFQTCAVDGDCANLGARFRCDVGVCRAQTDAGAGGATHEPASGGTPATGGAQTTGTGGTAGTPNTGGINGTGAGNGTGGAGVGSGGRRDGGEGPENIDGGLVSSNDAGFSGHFSTTITPDTVGCGSIPACQSPVGKCCSSTVAAGGGGCGPMDGVCSSNISLECDGPEDCTTGLCSGEPYGGGVETTCASTPGTYVMCHDHTQCSSAAPNCCPIFTDQFAPFLGECDSRALVSSGACDVPGDTEPTPPTGPKGTPYKTNITPNEIGCGTTPACESPVIQCCGDFSEAGGTCASATGICTSQLTLLCDGPEDCASGVCSGEASGGGVQTQCKPSAGTYQICHDHTQCPGAAPNCCPIYSGDFKPYLGECDTRTARSTGTCDTP